MRATGAPKRARDGGFTLIELVFAITLSLMIGGVVVAALITSLNVSRTMNEQVGDSTDAGLITTYLTRDAQSAGGIVPTTAIRDATIGVSNANTTAGWAGCQQPAPATLVVRFSWIERTSTLAAGQDTVVATYGLNATTFELTRRLCRDSTTGPDVVMGRDIATAAATCNVATCSATSTFVSLAVTGKGTRAPLAYTQKASLRADTQATLAGTNTIPVPLLALGVPGSAVCPNVDIAGTGFVTVVGNALVDAQCGASPIRDPSVLLSPTGVASTVAGIVDPYVTAGRTKPAGTCASTANPATIGLSASATTIVRYDQPVNLTANTAFQAGRYIFCKGLTFTSGVITGSNVLLYIATGTFEVKAAATVNMTGQTTTDKQMLVWSAEANKPIKIAGGTRVSSYRGLIYAPTSKMELSGTMAGNIGSINTQGLTVTGAGQARIGLPIGVSTIAPATLPAGATGVPYSASLSASGSGTTYTWCAPTLTSCAVPYALSGLPSDFSINATTGVLSGTPTIPNPPTIVVTAFDSTKAATSMDYTIAVVKRSYFDTINATPGLINYWRLGDANGGASSDTFSTDAGATLQTHTGETGTWAKPVGTWADAVVTTSTGRIRKSGTNTGVALYYSSATPTTADYKVEADVYVPSLPLPTNDAIGVVGRLDPTSGNYYQAFYEYSSQKWTLAKKTSGTFTWIGQSNVASLSVGTYRLTLDMSGTTIRLLVNGVQQVTANDSSITASGRGGVILGWNNQGTTQTDTVGMQLDNFTVSSIAPPLVDALGVNNGTYVNGPVLGAAGAIAGDANTAVQFDGVDDYASVARQISGDFSIELWFKSTQGIGTGATWASAAGLVDANVATGTNDFGVSLRSDGAVVAGVGATSIVSSTSGDDDGLWHHVVFTRTQTSGAMALYIDGALAGSGTTANRGAVMDAPTINFGRIQTVGNYYAGTMDEVAVYNAVMTPAMVTAHYNAAF